MLYVAGTELGSLYYVSKSTHNCINWVLLSPFHRLTESKGRAGILTQFGKILKLILLSTVYTSLKDNNTYQIHYYFKRHFVNGNVEVFLLFRHSVLPSSLSPHGLQHVRLPYPSLSLRACSNPCPLSQRCHPAISSSVTLFSSGPQSSPASVSFPTSQWCRSALHNIHYQHNGDNAAVTTIISVNF